MMKLYTKAVELVLQACMIRKAEKETKVQKTAISLEKKHKVLNKASKIVKTL